MRSSAGWEWMQRRDQRSAPRLIGLNWGLYHHVRLLLPPLASTRKFRAANWTWLRLCSRFINFFLWREKIDFPRAQPSEAEQGPLQTFARLSTTPRVVFFLSPPSILSSAFPLSLKTKQIIYNWPALQEGGERGLQCTAFQYFSHCLVSSFKTFTLPKNQIKDICSSLSIVL